MGVGPSLYDVNLSVYDGGVEEEDGIVLRHGEGVDAAQLLRYKLADHLGSLHSTQYTVHSLSKPISWN